jgi:hypothetical protein
MPEGLSRQSLLEALLAETGTHRMEQVGVTPNWNIKDTVAHFTTWWRREVACLAAAGRGERPLGDVLRDAEDAWRQFHELLQRLPENTLFDPDRFAWMEGRALGAAVLGDFVSHLREEHEPRLRQWLDQERFEGR